MKYRRRSLTALPDWRDKAAYQRAWRASRAPKGFSHRGKKRDRIDRYINSKKSMPCMDCGYTFPSECMDYDHVRGEKLFGVSQMSSRSVSMQDVADEIAKCDLVCANCHRIRHKTRVTGVLTYMNRRTKEAA